MQNFSFIKHEKHEKASILNIEDNYFSKAVCLNASAGLIVSENQKNITDAYKLTRKHIFQRKFFKRAESSYYSCEFFSKNKPKEAAEHTVRMK